MKVVWVHKLLACAAAVIVLAGLSTSVLSQAATAATAVTAPAPPGPYPVLTDYSNLPPAVQSWETSAETQVAALRGVSDDQRNQSWSRGEIQANMYAQLLNKATEPNPSSDDKAVTTWFAQQVTAQQEALAVEAQDLFNQWQGNECGFEPPIAAGYQLPVPPGYQTDWSQSQSEFCESLEYDPTACILSGACSPSPPSADQFTAWAAAYIQQQNIVTWGKELLSLGPTLATDQPATVLDAQQQAQAEYEGSVGSFQEGVSFLSAADSALQGVTTPDPAETDFGGAWDAIAERLGDQAQDAITHTAIDALMSVFEGAGSFNSADGVPADFLESQAFQDLLQTTVENSAEVDWGSVLGIGLLAAVVIADESFQVATDAAVPKQLQAAVDQYKTTVDLGSLSGTSDGQQEILSTLIGLSLPAFTLDRAAYQASLDPAGPGPTETADPAFHLNGATAPSYSFAYSDWQTGQDQNTSVDNGWFSQGPISSGSGPYPFEFVPSISYMTGPGHDPETFTQGANGVQEWRAWLDGDMFLTQRVAVSAGSGYVSEYQNTCPGTELVQGNVDNGAECVTADPHATTDGWSAATAPAFGLNIIPGDRVSIDGQVRQVVSITQNSSANTVAFITAAPFGDSATIAGDPVMIYTAPDPVGCLNVGSLGNRSPGGADCQLTSRLTMLTNSGSTNETVALTSAGNGGITPQLSISAPAQATGGTPIEIDVSSQLPGSLPAVTSCSGDITAGTFKCTSAVPAISVSDGAGQGCILQDITLKQGDGSCDFTETSGGTYTFTATFGGDDPYLPGSAVATVNVTDNRDPTSTSLSTTSSSVTYGSEVEFSASITPSDPNGCADGTVTFLDGPTQIGTSRLPAAACGPVAVTFTTTSLPVGDHEITARYSGDASETSSTSSAAEVNVSQISTTMGPIFASPRAAIYGKALTFTVSTDAPAGAQVAFQDIGSSSPIAVLGSAVVANGAASLTVPPLPVGAHEISAIYPGDAEHTSVGSLLTFSVTPAPLTVTASDGSQVYAGTPPPITPGYSGFVNGDSAASLTTAPACTPGTSASSAPGSYASSCAGAADPDYAFTYDNGTVTVTSAPLTVTASDGNQLYGGPLPVITPGYAGFVNGDSAASLTTAPACTPGTSASSAPGSYASSCAGAADPDYAFTYDNGTVTVGAATTTTTVSSSLDASMVGNSVTFTANVKPQYSGIPSGTVTFRDGGALIGTASLGTASGVTTAKLTVSNLALGQHPITAVYGGDGNFTGSTSPVTQQYVDTSLSHYPKLASGAYNLGNANLAGAYLADAPLAAANIVNSNLQFATFALANLTGANLSNSNLSGSDFTGADLAGANLTNANLKNAFLTGANLKGANLTNVNLTGATGLKSANLTNVIWSNTQCPDGTLSTRDGGTCQGHL